MLLVVPSLTGLGVAIPHNACWVSILSMCLVSPNSVSTLRGPYSKRKGPWLDQGARSGRAGPFFALFTCDRDFAKSGNAFWPRRLAQSGWLGLASFEGVLSLWCRANSKNSSLMNPLRSLNILDRSRCGVVRFFGIRSVALAVAGCDFLASGRANFEHRK